MMHDDIQRTDPKLLAKFLSGPEEGDRWAVDDLAAMVRHQLAAPLVSDLEAAFPGAGQRVAALGAGLQPPVSSFGELLAHPSPPVELLMLVKDMAKSAADGQGHALPQEVASYFYFASIAAAGRRAAARISTLSDERVRAGLAWLLQQPWVEAYPRQLLQDLQERP